MENNFKNLGKNVKAPEELKKEVFKSLDTFTLFADLVDLFTGKYAATEISFLDTSKNVIEKDKTVQNDETIKNQ